MSNNDEKVVKCAGCDKYFGYSEGNKNCPFCRAEYGKAEGRVQDRAKDLPAQTGKKVTTKTQKESFKIWKDS
jgi:hypothetical protein